MKLDIDILRAVEWDRSYLWDLTFADMSPGDTFGVTDVRFDYCNVATFDFSFGNLTGLSVPSSRNARGVHVSFLDDVTQKTTMWFVKWVRETIFGKGGLTVAPLHDVVKKVTFIKQDSLRAQVGTPEHFWVYPKEAIGFLGNSMSDVNPQQVYFVIAGQAGESRN